MIFTKLRLLGFKSFVEPVEFIIEPGLTGVVGPNGCGKSNLVEAMRWVMGENSYKNMRASGMEDVIFSGSSSRPSRNAAEVTLFIDNSTRTAPAAFNNDEELHVSRRIERDVGSIYRINSKDVRAKDVQLLFADASTGARSPSMVGQGRIGELISAKPTARRALLEEAAGISGLHSRRHEAELRLRGADQNLERLEDVIAQIENQLESLKRQARQAKRYRQVSANIRKSESLLFYLRWVSAKESEAKATSQHNQSVLHVGESAQLQANAVKQQAIIAHKLPDLRDNEATSAASLQRLNIAQNQIDEDIARIARRKIELEQRSRQLENDITREKSADSDHTMMLDNLAAEERKLHAQSRDAENSEINFKKAHDETSQQLGISENNFADLTASLAQETAKKSQLELNLKSLSDRQMRLRNEAIKSTDELNGVLKKIAQLPGPDSHQAKVSQMEQESSKAEALVLHSEEHAQVALKAEHDARTPLNVTQSELERIETETRTLAAIINVQGQDLFAPVIDNIKVEPGFEVALGAALGEDLDISTDASASVYWGLIESGSGDPPLPPAAQPLSQSVNAPPELMRRLAQVGVVSENTGSELQKFLHPGQLLVTKIGQIWRWDGYVAKADAPTAAAQKLANKNRLAELDHQAGLVAKKLRKMEEHYNELKTHSQLAHESERDARENWRDLQKQLFDAREGLAVAERAVGQFATRRTVLEEAALRYRGEIEECTNAIKHARATCDDTIDLGELEGELNALRTRVAQDRAQMAETRVASESISREVEARARRLQVILAERESWKERMAGTQKHMGELVRRQEEAQSELGKIKEAPREAGARRKALADQIEISKSERQIAADNLAATETELAQADNLAKQALLALSDTKELSARAEERLNAARERRSDIEERIREELNCQPHETRKLAELEEEEEDNAQLSHVSKVERDLEKLRNERERLGAVNLRAETEQIDIAQQHETIINERDSFIWRWYCRIAIGGIR